MPSAVSGIVGGLFGSQNTPSAPNLTTYQPTGTAAADQSFQSLLSSMTANNPNAAYTPQATSTFNSQYNNPFASAFQTASNNAGNALTTTGNNAVNASGQINAAALAGLPGAQQILQMGFDPQNELYNRTLQQLNDQVAVNQASRGTTMSPYGASIANTADSNFNIDWQNNQLSRALSAMTGYDSAITSAGNQAQTAGQLGNAGASSINAGGQLPFTTANSIASNQSDALNQLLSVINGGNSNTQQSLGDYLSYLGLGANQSNTQANLNQTAYQNQLKASQSAASGIGGLASSLFQGAGAINAADTASAAGDGSFWSTLLQYAPDVAAAAA